MSLLYIDVYGERETDIKIDSTFQITVLCAQKELSANMNLAE